MKAVSDVVAPLSGEVVEVNEALADAPERINEDPYGDGLAGQGPAHRPRRGRHAARRRRLPRPARRLTAPPARTAATESGGRTYPAAVRGAGRRRHAAPAIEARAGALASLTAVSRYTSATDADRAAMLAAIGVDVDRASSSTTSPPSCGSTAASTCPPGRSESEVFDELRGARGAQRRRRLRALLPRRRDVRPLRAGARRRDHLALGVPHPLHALPARGLAGRAAGDVRVPDRDLRADRAPGRQRLDVRGPLGGRRRRLPGARRRQGPRPPRRLARAAPARRETLATYARGLRRRGGRGRPRGRAHRPGGARRRRSTTAPPRCCVQNPNFLGAVEDLAALADAAHEAGALCVASVDPITLGVLRPPGECGVDIAVGEGQPLGNRLDFGGPSFGFFAADRRAPAPDARPDRGRDHRRRRPARLRARAADARAAHPPREGDPQHLHLAGAERARRDDLPRAGSAARGSSSSASCSSAAPPTRASA